jgi:hypothetical protein
MEFIFPFVFGCISVTVFLLYINGYFELFYTLIKGFKLMNKTMKELNITPDNLTQMTAMFLNNKNENVNKSYLSKSGKCMHIYYDFLGKEYMITVPYNRLSSVDMIQYQVDAIYQDGANLAITQQPGIPYLVNSKDLGCYKIKAINHETDAWHEYKNDEIPHYCSEICDI